MLIKKKNENFFFYLLFLTLFLSYKFPNNLILIQLVQINYGLIHFQIFIILKLLK